MVKLSGTILCILTGCPKRKGLQKQALNWIETYAREP